MSHLKNSQKRPLRGLFARSGSKGTHPAPPSGVIQKVHPCIKSTCPKGKCTKDKCPKGKSPKGKCLRGSSKCSIGQLFKGLSFLDGGSKWQNVFPVFPDFQTSRFRNPKTAYEVLILRSRPISRHLDDDRATSGCRDLHPRSSYLREIPDCRRVVVSLGRSV